MSHEKIRNSMNASWRQRKSRGWQRWPGVDPQSSKPDDTSRFSGPETGKITDYATPEGKGCGSDLKDDPQGISGAFRTPFNLPGSTPATKKFT